MDDLIGNVTDATIDEYASSPAAVVVFGHSHIQYVAVHDGVLFVNPGGAGRPWNFHMLMPAMRLWIATTPESLPSPTRVRTRWAGR
jgi:hypothetical protein